MEPPKGPPADASGPAEGATPAKAANAEHVRDARTRRRRAVRQYLIVGLCLVALLCLGGVAAGVLFYDRATKPDLSTPDHVTRKYLEAYLIDRDDYTAKRYECADPSGLRDVEALRSDIDNRQKRYGVTFTYSVGGINETSRANNAAGLDVTLVLTTTIQGQSRREVEHWQMTARNENGWRVCAAHEVD